MEGTTGSAVLETAKGPAVKFRSLSVAFLAAALTLPAAPRAATHDGRNVDGRWYEGRAVSTTFGSYACQIKFSGDRALIKLSEAGIQIVGMLDEEGILDPHDIVVNDPKRGVYWTLDCFDMNR